MDRESVVLTQSSLLWCDAIRSSCGTSQLQAIHSHGVHVGHVMLDCGPIVALCRNWPLNRTGAHASRGPHVGCGCSANATRSTLPFCNGIILICDICHDGMAQGVVHVGHVMSSGMQSVYRIVKPAQDYSVVSKDPRPYTSCAGWVSIGHMLCT